MSVNSILQGQVHKINGQTFNRDLTLDDIGATSVDSLNPPITEAGDIITFQSKKAGNPINPLIVNIEPVQAGSGDPSPTNIRPITGWTGAKVTRAGKNLLDMTSRTFYKNGAATMARSGNVFTVTFTATTTSHSSNGIYLSIFDKAIQPYYGQTCVFSFAMRRTTGTGGTVRIGFGTISEAKIVSTTAEWQRYSIPIKWDQIFICYADSQTEGNTIELQDFQIELSSLATNYEPYQGITYSISFPSEAGTVYGGTLDVARGLLTVTHSITGLGARTWLEEEGNANSVFRTALSNRKIGEAGSLDVYGICESYTFYGNGAYSNLVTRLGDGQFGYQHTTNHVVFKDSRFTNVTDFKTAVSGIHLVFERATPLTYQLTPQEVTTLLGANCIFADCGDVDVTYRAGDKPAILTTADIGVYGGVAPYNEIVAAIISQGANV